MITVICSCGEKLQGTSKMTPQGDIEVKLGGICGPCKQAILSEAVVTVFESVRTLLAEQQGVKFKHRQPKTKKTGNGGTPTQKTPPESPNEPIRPCPKTMDKDGVMDDVYESVCLDSCSEPERKQCPSWS